MKNLIPLLVGGILLVVTGCAALQKGVDGTVAWLDKPVTTQPGAPTHEQTVRVVLDTTAAATAPTPAGPIIGGIAGVVAIGFGVLRKLSSKDHSTINDKIDAVGEVAKGIAVAVNAPPVPPAPSAPPVVSSDPAAK